MQMRKLHLKALTLAASGFALACGSSQASDPNSSDPSLSDPSLSDHNFEAGEEASVQASSLQVDSAYGLIEAFEAAKTGSPLAMLGLFAEIDDVMRITGAEVEEPTVLPLTGILGRQSGLQLPACITKTDTTIIWEQCQWGPITVDGQATAEEGHFAMDLTVVYDGPCGTCNIHVTHDYSWSDTEIEGVTCFEKDCGDLNIDAASRVSMNRAGQCPEGTVEASVKVDGPTTFSKGATLTLGPNCGDVSFVTGDPDISCSAPEAE